MGNFDAIPLVLAGLIRKRATLSGEIEALRTRVANLQADLAHLDAVIRIMDPASDPEAIRPKVPRNRCDWFGRGELARLAMDAVREAPESVAALDIARTVMLRKGLEPSSYTLRRIKGMVDAALRRREGLMERVVYGRRKVAWKVAA
jgi:hypothetical protein